MKPRRALLALVLLSFLLVFGWLVWMRASGDIAYRPLAPPPGAGPTPIGHPWFGAVHVHSELSGDASGALEEIVAAAEEAGLDFVVMAEHTRAAGSRGRQRGGWYGNVLVVIGEEISTTGGHLLALGVPPHPWALGPTPRQAIADVAELGGHALIAHPFGGENSWTGGWTGAEGAEVVSLYSALGRASEAGMLRALAAYPINPMAATSRLLRAPSPAIDAWDRHTALSGELPRRLSGVAAVDSHGPVWLSLPSHAAALASLQTLVWLAEPPEPGGNDRVQAARVAEALAEGRAAAVVSAVGVRPAFVFHAEDGAGRVVPPGGVAPWDEGDWRLQADLPGDGPWETVLRRDGVEVARVLGGALDHAVTEPGTYRVEVWRVGGDEPPPGAPPWVLSNPIYVWPSTAVAAARIRPVPPLPPPAVSRDLLALPGWSAASDAGAHSALAVAGQGLVWDLRLGAEEVNDRFAGLTWHPEGTVDWSGLRGLAVAARSDERWRIGLRVWTAEGDGSEATWERVFAAGPEGRPVAALWDDFRRLEAGAADADGAAGADGLGARLERILGAALVVTPQRMRPGTETRIEVLRLGLF